MRLICPLCGPRDRREFAWVGTGNLLHRPTSAGEFSDWLHLRDNPAGPLEEVWLHEAGCGALLTGTRDTRNHAAGPLALIGGAP